MHVNHHKIQYAILFAFLYLISPAGFSFEQMPISDLWKSQIFRNTFTASYGVDASVEPSISSEEKQVLDSVADKMKKANRAGSIIKLKESIWLPKSPALNFTLANLLIEDARIDDALPHFEVAIKLYPSFRDAYRNLALAYVQQDDAKKALPNLIRAIELGARDGLTYGLLGWCHTASENHSCALQAYRQAQLVMLDEWQWRLGEAYAQLALEEAAAVKNFGELIPEQPTNSMLWLAQSDAFMMIEKYEQAIVNREVVRRMGKLSGDGLAMLRHLYLNEALPNSAASCYQEAAKANASTEQLLEGLERLLATKHWEKARKLSEAIGEVPPKQQKRHNRANALLELESGNMKKGEKAVKAMLELDPTDTDAMLLLASAYRKTERLEEATLLLEQAARQPEAEAEALLLLGQILAEQGQYKNAINVLERAAQLNATPATKKYISALKNFIRSTS